MLKYSIASAAKYGKRAKQLRESMTPGEKVLWKKIRSKRFHGFKFRRQVPIGPYIVDFLCVDQKLIIEVDGNSHFEEGAQEKDQRRQKYLEQHGFTVLRFLNHDVVETSEVVLERLGRFLGCYNN